MNEDNADLMEKLEETQIFLKQFKEFSHYSETDLAGVIIDVSDSFCELLGYKKIELIGQTHSIIKHPKEDTAKYRQLWKNLSEGKSWIGELRCVDKEGKDVWYNTNIFPRINTNNETIGYVAKRYNIADQKHAELLSITDDLTSLYNRRYFNKIFCKEKERALREKNNLIFIMIDIDYFKLYNDTYGHLQGDEALKQIASAIQKSSRRANDFSFRLGGEEFCIITSGMEKEKAIFYGESILQEIQSLKISHEKSPYGFLTVSMGIYIFHPNYFLECKEIYKLADEALYEAKNSGRNRLHIL